MSNFVPSKTGNTRVFLIEGRAGPDNQPSFQSCLKAGSPDQSFGDVTDIKCPDPNAYGKYVVIGQIQGEQGRATVDLTGRYALDLESTLLRLARERCPVDVQIHMGACKNPSDFNQYDKILVLESAIPTNWSTDGDLGSLTDADESAINEVAPVSADTMYEILPLLVIERGQSVVTNEVLDVISYDTHACGGDCETESDGCMKFYAISTAAGGSPTTPADILSSPDKGTTWYADDIDSLGAAEAPSALAGLGRYIVVVSNASNSLHYALQSEIDTIGFDETWTEVTTGFVAAAEPNDCFRARGGVVLWIVGDGGYIYKCTDPTTGVTAVDAGVATTEDLRAVHCYSDSFVLAGGDNGSLVFCTDGATFVTAPTSPFGAAEQIRAVWAKSKTEWWVGGSTGELFYSLDGGDSWTLVADYGASIYDIAFANDTIMYVASATAAVAGQIRRSLDGGYSFNVLPETTTTMPANDRINAVAACPEDPNLVVGVGLADDASDGIIVVGSN